MSCTYKLKHNKKTKPIRRSKTKTTRRSKTGGSGRDEEINLLPEDASIVHAPKTTMPKPIEDFWYTIFDEDHLHKIRDTIAEWINDSLTPGKISICDKIKRYLPHFSLKTSTEVRNAYDVLYLTPEQLQHINVVSCATFIIMGIISNQFEARHFHCNLVLKGGKSIQTALKDFAYASHDPNYTSDDIDFLLLTTGEYEYNAISDIAMKIGFLVQWVIQSKTSISSISIKSSKYPYEDDKFNQYVTKLSYQLAKGRFLALLDIDTKPSTTKLENAGEQALLKHVKFPDIDFYVGKYLSFTTFTFDFESESDLRVLLFYLKLDYAFDEKIYVYIKVYLLNLQSGTYGDYLIKFQKPILALLQYKYQKYKESLPHRQRPKPYHVICHDIFYDSINRMRITSIDCALFGVHPQHKQYIKGVMVYCPFFEQIFTTLMNRMSITKA